MVESENSGVVVLRSMAGRAKTGVGLLSGFHAERGLSPYSTCSYEGWYPSCIYKWGGVFTCPLVLGDTGTSWEGGQSS